jgi:xanthine dehydrogenase accessory factor
LVASKTKWRVIADGLRNAGVAEAAIGRVRAPVGLDLGAETPAEVALAIMAEVVAVRNGGAGASLAKSLPAGISSGIIAGSSPAA